MAKAVIFDLYGVLALNGWQAFKTSHLTDKPETWDEVFELGLQVDAGLANYDELLRFTAIKTGESEATVRYQLEHTTANTELLAFIEHSLKPHYKLGILSNASGNVLERVFTRRQRQLFDAAVLSHHVGLTKPDTRMYETVANRLGVRPAACVYVDDQERHTAGARAAGMQTILYKEFAQFKTDLEKLLADT